MRKLSPMDKVKVKADVLKAERENNTSLQVEVYPESIIDYMSLGISEKEEKEKLMDYERKARFNSMKISKSLMELSVIFSESQKILSHYGSGTFAKWFEELGFKKDFVYMCLKRNELYTKVEDNKVFEITDRAVKTIYKIESKLELDEVKEIIGSDKPLERAKEKANEFSGMPENLTTKNIPNRIAKLEKKIEDYLKKIQDIEDEISKLKQSEENFI